jgi:hypothetical protein
VIARAGLVLVALVRVARADDPPPDPVPAPDPAPAPVPEAMTRPAPVPAEPPPADVAAPVDEPAPPAFAPWPSARLAFDLELFTSARWTHQTGDDLTELRLDRGEAGVRVALSPRAAAAELRLEAIRSAGEGGALGVDGDSMVVRVKYAQVTGTFDAGDVRVDGALGFVPDPWLRTVEDGYPLRALSRTASERLLGWPTADLSAEVRASFGPARLSIAAGNGEGLRYPERNTGKTTTAVLELVPLHTRELRLSLAGVGRDGSIGPASVRDRRAGGAATVVTAHVRGGFEAVHAWGLGGRGDVTGTALAGWAEAAVVPRAWVSARGATLGLAGGGRSSTFGGAVSAEPWLVPHGELRLWLAVDRVTTSGAASPVPGAVTGDATLIMLIASAEAPYWP